MRVIETSLQEDLSLFSSYLWQERIRHRVFEERGRQVLEVADTGQAAVVQQAYGDWQAGRLTLTAAPRSRRRPGLLLWCARFPGVLLLVVTAVILFPFAQPLSHGELTQVASWLTFVDLRTPMAQVPDVVDVITDGEVWRWFLPVFLHFGALHLLFNATVVIYLGSRVEACYGWQGLLLVVGVLGIASNIGQYAMNPNPLFGGLSGVGYGLLGFVLLLQRMRTDVAEWQVPPAFSGSMLFFLVLFTTGITEQFSDLRIANTAHWVGLVMGLLLGLFAHLGGSRRIP
jgi:GlpG protein